MHTFNPSLQSYTHIITSFKRSAYALENKAVSVPTVALPEVRAL